MELVVCGTAALFDSWGASVCVNRALAGGHVGLRVRVSQFKRGVTGSTEYLRPPCSGFSVSVINSLISCFHKCFIVPSRMLSREAPCVKMKVGMSYTVILLTPDQPHV